jgi:hypothetical protein
VGYPLPQVLQRGSEETGAVGRLFGFSGSIAFETVCLPPVAVEPRETLELDSAAMARTAPRISPESLLGSSGRYDKVQAGT